MKVLLIGNAVSLLGGLLMVSLGLVKKKEHVFLGQCFMFLIFGAGNLILGGYIGTINNLVSMVRNVIGLKKDFNIRWKLIFCAIPIGITALVNTEGLIGWLPVLATCSFTWILNTKSDSVVKLAVMFGQACWLFYDIHYINVSSSVFDILTIATNAVGLLMIRRASKEGAKAEKN